MKSAAEQLAERDLLGENTFVRNPGKEDFLINGEDEMIQVGLFELIDAFQKILENISPAQRVELTADKLSVKDRISEIVDILEAQGSVTFSELFTVDSVKSDIVVTFLALLEMVKLSLIRIVQHVQTGIIRLFYL
jgi:segregation and condensation protein A